ncbi:MAG: hypothetical protein HZA54_05100 [Planctomycetes bacterium]|nr:hypothetical protein [Planctomycetota bacterium]
MNGAACSKAACAKKIGAIVGLTAVLGSGVLYGAYRMGWVACPCTGQTYQEAHQAAPEVKPVQ